MANHVVNVKELKKEKKLREKAPKKPQKQIEPLYLWILYGTGAGIVFVLLAFINIQFIYLAPLGPILGIVGWVIKKYYTGLTSEKIPTSDNFTFSASLCEAL